MNNSLKEMVTTHKENCERLTERIDALSEKVGSPEITKTWLVGAFGLVGGLMGLASAVLVAIITNADKISKLIGMGG